MSYAEVELDDVRWSEARQIIPNSTPMAQSIKACEEINELVDALRNGDKAEAIRTRQLEQREAAALKATQEKSLS